MRNPFPTALIIQAVVLCLLASCDPPKKDPPTALTPCRFDSWLGASTHGYIDATGDFRIDPDFEQAEEFSDGLAMAQTWDTRRWGILRLDGTWAVAPTLNLDNARKFSEDLCAVQQDGKYGFIRKDGTFQIQPTFSFVDDFSDGLAAASQGTKHGYIDPSGAWVDPRSHSAFPFAQGLAVEKEGDKYGIINKQGDWVTRPLYDYLEQSPDGWFCYRKDNSVGFFHPDGHILRDPAWVEAHAPTEGLARVHVSKQGWGAVDMHAGGKLAVQARWHELGEFSDGMAHFWHYDVHGYIDRTGKVIIRLNLGENILDCEPFKNGLAHVRVGDAYEGYINKQGQWVYKRKFKR